MSDLSWLRRPFDTRYVYALGGILGGILLTLLTFEAIPLPLIVRRWVGRLAIPVCVGLCYRSRENRKHTVPRGVGWFAMGMIAGCVVRDVIRKGPIDVLPIGIILAALVYALWKEWQERELQKE